MSGFPADKVAPWFLPNLTLLRASIARVKREISVPNGLKVMRRSFGGYAGWEFTSDVTRIFACTAAMEELDLFDTRLYDLLDELGDVILEKER
jgi:hypothetical protein